MPKINVLTRIKSLDNDFIMDDTKKKLTFRTIACLCLNYTDQNKPLDWKQKLQCGELMSKLGHLDPIVDLKSDDLAFIKEKAGNCPLVTPWIAKQIDDICEGVYVEPPENETKLHVVTNS